MKKKIMFLITGLNYGGMERVVFIAYELLKEHYDLDIVALYSKNADYTPEFRYIDLNCPPLDKKIFKYFNTVKRVLKVKKIKKDINPDIVISFGTAANFANSLTKKNNKVVLGIRSYDWLTNYFVNFSIDKWTYKRADMIISVSKLIAKDSKNKFGIESKKSEYLYNPYDRDLILERSNEKIFEMNLPKDKRFIISVGRLVNQKGYNHLLKAFSIIVKNNKDIDLIIIGKGEKESKLIKLINDLNLNDRVHLLGGQRNPYKFMRISEIYVLSSITEGFPNAMVEAMAVGLPIVATNCKSGPSEILMDSVDSKNILGVTKGKYGIMTPEVTNSFNYEYNFIEECDIQLAKGIECIINDRNLKNYYSKKSQERVENFSYEKFENKLIKLFENVTK